MTVFCDARSAYGSKDATGRQMMKAGLTTREACLARQNLQFIRFNHWRHHARYGAVSDGELWFVIVQPYHAPTTTVDRSRV